MGELNQRRSLLLWFVVALAPVYGLIAIVILTMPDRATVTATSGVQSGAAQVTAGQDTADNRLTSLQLLDTDSVVSDSIGVEPVDAWVSAPVSADETSYRTTTARIWWAPGFSPKRRCYVSIAWPIGNKATRFVVVDEAWCEGLR